MVQRSERLGERAVALGRGRGGARVAIGSASSILSRGQLRDAAKRSRHVQLLDLIGHAVERRRRHVHGLTFQVLQRARARESDTAL